MDDRKNNTNELLLQLHRLQDLRVLAIWSYLRHELQTIPPFRLPLLHTFTTPSYAWKLTELMSQWDLPSLRVLDTPFGSQNKLLQKFSGQLQCLSTSYLITFFPPSPLAQADATLRCLILRAVCEDEYPVADGLEFIDSLDISKVEVVGIDQVLTVLTTLWELLTDVSRTPALKTVFVGAPPENLDRDVIGESIYRDLQARGAELLVQRDGRYVRSRDP